MSRGRHAAGGGTFSRDLVVTLVGIVVVAGLVFGGLWLYSLFFGDDGFEAVPPSSTSVGSTVTSAAASSVPSEPGTTASTAPAETTTPTLTVRSPSEITVQVLNSVGTTGLAADVTTDLRAAGYQTVAADDYEPLLDQSQVLFRDGYGPEAFELAALFPDAQVGMSPDVPEGVDIIVLLGTSFGAE